MLDVLEIASPATPDSVKRRPRLGAMMVGGAGERQPGDFYPTPAEVTEVLLDRHCVLPPETAGSVWEPFSGDDAIVGRLEARGYTVNASDIEPRGRGIQADFLTAALPAGTVSIVTNPPFQNAAAMIRHALSHELGFVAMLLKATFWHAANRQPLFRHNPPSYIHPLTWRPDFLGLGRPTMEVAWCVWTAGGNGITAYEPLSRPGHIPGQRRRRAAAPPIILTGVVPPLA